MQMPMYDVRPFGDTVVLRSQNAENNVTAIFSGRKEFVLHYSVLWQTCVVRYLTSTGVESEIALVNTNSVVHILTVHNT
jgi:hypothetical protein